MNPLWNPLRAGRTWLVISSALVAQAQMPAAAQDQSARSLTPRQALQRARALNRHLDAINGALAEISLLRPFMLIAARPK